MGNAFSDRLVHRVDRDAGPHHLYHSHETHPVLDQPSKRVCVLECGWDGCLCLGDTVYAAWGTLFVCHTSADAPPRNYRYRGGISRRGRNSEIFLLPPLRSRPVVIPHSLCDEHGWCLE